MAQRGLAEGRGLFNWHIGNQHRIDADFLALGIKLINAFVKHQIGIHQQANGNGRVFLANQCQHFKTLCRSHTCRKGAQSGVLNGRAIRQWVGEGDT